MNTNYARVTVLFSDQDEDLSLWKWRGDGRGYARVTRGGVAVFAHHIVCERAFGRRPDKSKGECCDHINRIRTDNRRENLRITDLVENRRNRTINEPEFKRQWTTYIPYLKKWQSQFQYQKRPYYLGLFLTQEEAHEAAKAKLIEMGATIYQP